MTRRLSMPAISRRGFIQLAGGGIGLSMMPGAAFAQSAPQLWCTGATVESIPVWADLFKEKTGLAIEYFRAGSVQLAQRIEQENKSGQGSCDTLELTAVGLMVQWANDGLLLEHHSPEAAHYPADAQMKGFWAPVKAIDMCMAYNAEIIKPDDAPKTWEHLLDPKWKGKMVMADPSFSGAALHWYGALRMALGKEFMHNLAKQDVLIRKGAGEVVNTVVSGERPIAASLNTNHAFSAVSRGGDVNVVFPDEGLPITYEVMGISKKAPHAEAAKQFMDFALGYDAQVAWQKIAILSMRDDVPPLPSERGRRPLSEVKMIHSTVEDHVKLLGMQNELLEEFSTLFK